MAILGPLMALALACAPAQASEIGRERDAAAIPVIQAAPTSLQPLSPAVGLAPATLPAGVTLPASALAGGGASAGLASSAKLPGASAPAAPAATAATAGLRSHTAAAPRAAAAPAPEAGQAASRSASAAAAQKPLDAIQATRAQGGDEAAAAAEELGRLFDRAGAARAGSGAATETGAGAKAEDFDAMLHLAQTLSPLDAPAFYGKASKAVAALPRLERAAAVKTLTRSAEERAPKAVFDLIHQAFEKAKTGALDRGEQRAHFNALEFWNAALEHAQTSPLQDANAVEASLLQIQAQAAAGKTTASWQLSFTKILSETPFKTQVNFVDTSAAPPGWAPSTPTAPAGVAAPAAALSFSARYALARGLGAGPVSAFWTAASRSAAAALASAWRAVKTEVAGWFREREEPRDSLVDDEQEDEPFAVLDKKAGGEELSVHRPRARAYQASGYRLLHAAPRGVGAEPVKDEGVAVRVGRGGDEKSLAALRARFDAFNRLIEANFAALELIAQNPHAMTAKQARALTERVRLMASELKSLASQKTADAQAMSVAKVARALDDLIGGLADSELIPPAALELVVPIEKESLHKYVNAIHQLALEQVGRVGSGGSANFFVALTKGAKKKRLALIDLSNDPLIRDGRVVSPGFKALTEALAKSADTPKGSLMMQDHQFWGHFKLGAHSAEIFASFLPPDEGGMIRVRYQEWGTDIYNQSRLYYVARTLQKLGFTVKQENGFLTAIVDKDHESQTADRMRDSFAMIVQALHATVGLDFALPIILKGSTSSEESGRRIDEWVDIVLAEGGLPFYERDKHENMVRGFREYREKDAQREKLKQALDRELARLGLPALPADAPLGQRLIDTGYNGALELALARGELRSAADGAVRVKGFDPLGALAQELSQGGAAAARMAEAVGSLDPGLFEFQTIGTIGALTAQRAQRRLDSNTWLNLYVLRDPQTGQAGFARAELGTLTTGPKRLSPERVFALLAEQGHPVAAFKPSENPPGLALYTRKLRQAPMPSVSATRSFSGLAASPGDGRPVTARVTFDAKTASGEGGRVFIAPYTSPDDLDAIRRSKAVVTTSGGLLSHAAITTREMGIGAVILGQARWSGGKLLLASEDFSANRLVAGLPVRTVAARRDVQLSEGDVVRVDPASGAFDVYPAEQNKMMLALARRLDAYDQGKDAAPLAEWTAQVMTHDSVDDGQRLVFARELLGALASRAAGNPLIVSHLRAVRTALRANATPSLLSGVAAAEDRLYGAERSAALLDWRDLSEQLQEAGTLPGAERMAAAAASRLDRLTLIGAALERPTGDAKQAEDAHAAFTAASRAKISALLAEDIKELEEHARLYPSVTVEILPRLKSLVAKAKRRNLAPRYYESWEADIARLEAKRRVTRGAGPLVLPLQSVLDADAGLVGGKGAKLGEIAEVVARAGGRTAPGFAVTVEAYREFIRRAGLEHEIERLASSKELSPEEKAERIQKLIRAAPLTANTPLGALLLGQLESAGLRGRPLAVRSSAVDEDGAAAAFAGAGDTHLYVSHEEALEKVKEVWASLWNPRALLYRQTKGLAVTGLAQAVVVQAMVPSEVSGVAFTEDPVSGNSGRLVVNAAFGLGEGIVSGRVAPDQFVLLKKHGREILPAMIADKKLKIVGKGDGTGVEEKRVAAESRRARSLSPSQLETLNTVSVALENHFGYALDIEFAFVGEALYVLQARPVTNAAPAEAAPPAPLAAPAAPKAPARGVLFVCAGNTCRSPMAAVMLRQELEDLSVKNIPVASRGLYAEDGKPISAGSAAALAERGLDASDHRSASLQAADVAGAALILVMEPGQRDALLRRFPEAKGRVHLLSEFGGQGPRAVADPFGGNAAEYEATAHQLEKAVGGVALRLAGELSSAR